MFGLPDGMIGVAWPAIRAGLGLPLDRLGVLLVANTAGYLLTSAANGLLVRRPGTRALVAGAARRSAVPLGLLAFFFVSGLEISAGAWAATYLRGYLGLSAAAAGLGVFGYWAALTASRLAAGALPHRQGPRQLALAGCVVA